MGTPLASDTELQIATDVAFANIIHKSSGTYRTSEDINNGVLDEGTTYYTRMRHTAGQDEDAVISNWSPSVKFSTNIQANVIGVCYEKPSSSHPNGVWSWIDANGNKLNTFDYHTHPTFRNLRNVTLGDDNDLMIKIPCCYIKTATAGLAGTFSDGKMCWWLSDRLVTGFRPHPAFKRSTTKGSNGKFNILSSIFLARYNALINTNIYSHEHSVGYPGSGATMVTIGDATAVRMKVNPLLSNKNIRNTVKGWRLADIYDLSLLRLLKLISYGAGDWEKLIDTERQLAEGLILYHDASNETQTVTYCTHKQTAYELCEYRKNTSGSTVETTMDASTVYINPMDRSSTLTTDNYVYNNCVNGNAHIFKLVNVSVGNITIGDDTHNLMELFLPSSEMRVPDEDVGSTSFTHPGGMFIGASLVTQLNTVPYKAMYQPMGNAWTGETSGFMQTIFGTYIHDTNGYVALAKD